MLVVTRARCKVDCLVPRRPVRHHAELRDSTVPVLSSLHSFGLQTPSLRSRLLI